MDPDAERRAWLRDAFRHASRHFDVVPDGEPVFGWGDRSIGAPVSAAGEPRWLRVMREWPEWTAGWTGNADAADITGIARPVVLDTHEWQDAPFELRAELMTLLPGRAVAPAAWLERDPELTPRWWTTLRRSIDRISATPTERVCVGQEVVSRRLQIFFGDRVDPIVDRWQPAHGDLHWANLMAPDCALVDWEMWGLAPAGVDAATLRCYSLLVPATAARVHDVFADVLDTPDGVRSQLCVIARLLLRAEHGDHPQLVLPLHRLADELIADRVSMLR